MMERKLNPDSSTPEADLLVRRVLSGETAAFAGIICLYESEIWRIAASLLRDWSTTENLVQQSFIDAYAKLHQYKIGTDFGAWLRTLARNRIRKEFRSLSREESRLAIYREMVEERLRADQPVRDDEDAYLAALRGCREQLPDDDADLLQMRYERGMSFEAIAERRGMTPAAVQRAISRIRFRLRSCIEGYLRLI